VSFIAQTLHFQSSKGILNPQTLLNIAYTSRLRINSLL